MDLGGVPDPLFLGRSNPLTMKFERRGPSTAFSWLTHPLPLLFRENGRSGLFRAFPGVSFALLQNFSWAYPVLGGIPAPFWVVVFGASRRVWAGPRVFSMRVLFCKAVFRGKLGMGSELGSCAGGGERTVFSGACRGRIPYLIL